MLDVKVVVMATDRRLLLLLQLIVFAIICVAYLRTNLHLTPVLHPNRQTRIAVTSQPSTENWRQRPQQDSDDDAGSGIVTVERAGNLSDRVAAFNVVLSTLRLQELKRRGAPTD